MCAAGKALQRWTPAPSGRARALGVRGFRSGVKAKGFSCKNGMGREKQAPLQHCLRVPCRKGAWAHFKEQDYG